MPAAISALKPADLAMADTDWWPAGAHELRSENEAAHGVHELGFERHCGAPGDWNVLCCLVNRELVPSH